MSDRDFETRAELAAHQLERLRHVVGRLATTNPFYGPRLAEAGLGPSVASLAEFRERMPFTTKADLVRDRAEHPPYGSNLTHPLEAYSRLHQTSSTTGEPLRWLDTPEDWSWMLDGWQHVLDGAEVTAADRILFAFSFGPFIGFWLGFDTATRMGCLSIPGGALNSETRLRVIRENDVGVLCCTPTYAIRLGEVAHELGIEGPALPVEKIVVGGEPGACIPAIRARIEELWDARLFDHYGMTEVGPVTYQCLARRDAIHVIESNYLAEVVDLATGAPLPEGAEEPGELVLTSLGRVGSPLLRYRTGDLVRPEADRACACGSPTRTLAGGILARADQMEVVRGVNLYPSAIDAIVRSLDGVAEYRVEIRKGTGPTEVEVQVEPAPDRAPTAEALCRELEGAFRNAYSLRIPVVAVPAGELPRFELKARRWVVVA